jgi:tRNA A37 threonylcarbamoyladenosine synthetase subunit TsaC/SUA5/YrdC
LVSESGLIGVRLPGLCAAKILAEQAKHILTATSANRADEPNVCCHKDLAGLKGIEMIVEGRVQGGVGSTVVDASGERPMVLRQGSIDIGEG